MRNTVSLFAAFGIAVLCVSMSAAEGTHKDGYSFKNGKVLSMRDGKESTVTVEVSLGNGSRLLPDGFIIFKDGRREQFRESQWLGLDGEYVVVDATSDDFDGYYLEGGKVYVIRDSRPTVVLVEITFADGSRMSPDGMLILKDGTRNHLSEGQRVSKEGRHVEGKGSTAPRTPVKPVDASHKVEDTKKEAPAKSEKAPAPTEHQKPVAPTEHEKTPTPAPDKKQDTKQDNK